MLETHDIGYYRRKWGPDNKQLSAATTCSFRVIRWIGHNPQKPPGTSVIRFNIKNAEALLGNDQAFRNARLSERLSDLALASRAFAFYYMLQCLVASTLAKSARQRYFFYSLAAVLAFITLFAVPAG